MCESVCVWPCAWTSLCIFSEFAVLMRQNHSAWAPLNMVQANRRDSLYMLGAIISIQQWHCALGCLNHKTPPHWVMLSAHVMACQCADGLS